MITLTKIDGSIITVNCDEIETIETHHDSLISLKSGKKIVVKEGYEEITNLVIQFRKKCSSPNDIPS